jgi:TolB-like protein
LGEHSVKNIPHPVHAYGVLSEEPQKPAPDVGQVSSPPDRTAISDKPSIAVLPFVNMSTDPEHEFFSDGITEDVITALSKLKGFFVISRNTTIAYKGETIDPKKVASELGVRYLLQGSVRTSGSRARITAQLTDTGNSTELWAERYDRTLEDVFAIQDEITEQVVGCLEPELYSAEHDRLKRKPPQSLDAWENFIRGMFLYSQHSNEGTKEALALLQRAVELDRSYAQAHGLFALALAWRAIQGWEDMSKAMEKANSTANLAKACDPQEPWAYMAHGMIGIARRGGADTIEAFRHVIDFSPNFAYAHGLLGASIALSGRGEDAIEHIDRAVRLSPRDIFADEPLLYYAFAHFQAENYMNAAFNAEKAIQLRPGHPVLHIMASASRALAGDVENANAAVMNLKALVPEITASEIEQNFIYVMPEDRSRLADGLRLAGLG